MADFANLIDDLVDANRILYHHGVVDGYGHVSFRSPANPNTFFMAAAVSPGRVTAEDIIELDLDGEQVAKGGRQSYSERFIHAEIYRVRADVQSVVHSHSPAVIPFGVTDLPLRPIIHNAPFLHTGAPVFDTHHIPEATGPLINSAPVGKALATKLADNTVVLMRGHGDTVVGPTIRETVARAIYTEVNARLLLQTLALERPITYLASDEALAMMRAMDVGPGHGTDRVWRMWVDEIRAHADARTH
jgi:ribulose-5-phosphate 4-epimerase/fuculose-1-phosphate aldolase